MSVADLSTPLKFAYWVPNVSGGLVVSTIEQRTSWEFDHNRKLARIAEDAGFEYALSQTRCAASSGADKQHEADAARRAGVDFDPDESLAGTLPSKAGI